MKIQKFEKYKWDIEGGNIAEEYAKVIISKYMDKSNKLEKVFVDVINGDNLDDGQAGAIKLEIIEYLNKLIVNAKRIRPLHQIEAEKYNL